MVLCAVEIICDSNNVIERAEVIEHQSLQDLIDYPGFCGCNLYVKMFAAFCNT